MAVEVLVVEGPDAGERILLRAGRIVIGRSDSADLQLSDRGVAPRHVVVDMTHGEVIVHDTGTSEGTTIDGRSLTDLETVESPATLRLGSTVVTVTPRLGSAEVVPESLARPPAAPTVARPSFRAVRGLTGSGLFLAWLTLMDVLETLGPTGFALTLVAAVLPAPLLIGALYLVGRYEPEPWQLVLGCFGWGATGAAFLAGIANDSTWIFVDASLGTPAADLLVPVLAAPIYEELLKGAAVLFVFLRYADEFDGILDGLVYGAAVGLGFAVMEDLLYYARAYLAGPDIFSQVVWGRGVLSGYLHPLFTALTGIGIALTREVGRGRWMPAAVGLAGAIALHAAWNAAVLFIDVTRVAALLYVPTLLAVAVTAFLAQRHEGELLRRHLHPEIAAGTLTLPEVETLACLRARRQALREAAAADWGMARERLREFQHTAARLAFARHRAASGLRQEEGEEERLQLELELAKEALRPALFAEEPSG